MSRGQRDVVIVVITLILAVVAGIVFGSLTADRRQPRLRPLSELQIAEAWLRCIDCEGSFLKRISEISPESRDTVTQFFAAALRSGLDSATSARRAQALRRTWLADSAFLARSGKPPPTKPDSFVARYLRGSEVMWRSRAATALGVIRGDTALAALNSPLNLSPHDPGDSIILRAVEEAKADSTLKILDVFAPGGTGSPGGTGGGGTGTGRVSGKVVNDGGTALPSAQVEVVGLSLSAITGNNGEYMIDHVPPGTYSIRARMLGYQPRTANVTVVGGQTTSQDFALGH
jgi:hypothetical protein